MAEPTQSNPEPSSTSSEGKAETPPEFDATKLTSDQLSKVLENPELFKLPRIAALLDSDKQLKKLQKDQETAREQSLAEQKKFEDLANERGDKITALEKQIQDNLVTQHLTNELVKLNVVDLDGALKLVDRDKISVGDNGAVDGVTKAIESLKTEKSYLFTGSPANVGTASNPQGAQPGQAGQYKFKESQMTPEFFKANEKEIMEAYRLGQIEADGPPPIK